MNTITFKKETLENNELELIFEIAVSYDHILTTQSGIDNAAEILEFDFDNDPTQILNYELSCTFSPTETVFATSYGYGSDYADYESVNTPNTQSIEYLFGSEISDFIATELTRRNLPTTTSLYQP